MNLKRILKKIFCLSPGRTCAVALPSFAAAVLVFRAGLEDTAFAYYGKKRGIFLCWKKSASFLWESGS